MGSGAITGGFSGLGGAIGSITIDTSQLASARQVARQVGQDVTRSFGQIDTAAKRTQRSIGDLVGAFGNLGTIVATVVGSRMVQIGFQLAETAARADLTRAAFNNLATGAGQSGDQMLAAMRRASRGMIADADLVLAANRAMLLGVADSGEEMAQLLEVARVRGEAMGLSATQAFNDIVTGIGRLSPMILDNLGIITDAENTYAQYAVSIGRTGEALNDAEKRQALLNRVIADSRHLLDASGGAADSNAKKFQNFAASISNARVAVGDLLNALGAPTILQNFASQIDGIRQNVQGLTADLQRIGAILGAIQAGDFNAYIRASTSLGNSLLGRPSISQGIRDRTVPADLAPSPGPPAGPTPEQTAARIDFARQLTDIEKNAGQERTEAARQHAQQRAETISSYERSITREAEDFGRQRLRAQETLLRQIGEIEAEGRRRVAEWAADLAERIGELSQDSGQRIAEAQAATGKRIAEIERDYHRNRERAERDHRDRLMDAAARLDAVAVFNEQRQFRRQQQDAEQQHRERLDKEQDQLGERTAKEQESLAERIAQEQRAHARRLRDAKEADDRRIADMRADFVRRQAEEDADRAVRLRRMAEDHQAQLAQQAAAQAERIAQINRHEAEERKAAEDAHLTEMQQLGGVIAKGWLLIQEALEKAMLERYKKFEEELREATAIQGPTVAPQFPVNPFRGFADGGPVHRTGIARVHAGEFMLSRSMLAAINSATAGRVGPSSAAMGGPSLTLAPGAIVVNAADGQSEELIGQIVMSKLANHYRQMGAQ